MAAKKKKKSDDDEESGGSKKKMIIIVVLVVAVLGGAYETVLKPKAMAAPIPAGSIDTMGPVVTEASITVNLADGHYLQLTPAIQLAKGETIAKVSMGAAQITDLFIKTFSNQTVAALSTPAGLNPIKAEIVAGLSTLFPKQISGIYFTQFVMQ